MWAEEDSQNTYINDSNLHMGDLNQSTGHAMPWCQLECDETIVYSRSRYVISMGDDEVGEPVKVAKHAQSPRQHMS